jgi:signal transduction histidine kinase
MYEGSPTSIPATPTPETATRRHRSLPLPAWAAVIGAALVVGCIAVYGVVFDNTTSAALERVEAEGHQELADAGQGFIDERVTSSDNVLEDLYVNSDALASGTPELRRTLLASLIGTSSDINRFEMVSVTTADSYDAVGISGTAAQIGVATAENGSMIWAPFEGGPGVALPGFVPTERPSYTAAVANPEVIQHVGPVEGLDGKTQFTASLGGPGTSKVWSGSLPLTQLTKIVDLAFPETASTHTAVGLVTGDDVDVTWTSDDTPSSVRTAIAETIAAQNRDDQRTVVQRTIGDTRWRISVGPIFDDNRAVMWGFATADTADTRPDRGRLAATVTVLMFAAAAAGWVITRRLTRPLVGLTAAVATGDHVDGDAFRSRVSEYDDAAVAVSTRTAEAERTAQREQQRNERLAELHVRTERARHEERRRIAGQLHDGPLQGILAASLIADRGEVLPPEYLRDTRNALVQITEELTDGELDSSSLAARLHHVADTVSETHQFHVMVNVADGVLVERDEARVLLRGAHELLTNAKKHSGASSAELNVAVTESALQLSVTDTGVGFSNGSDGFGLFSLAVEVEQLGGTVSCEAGPNGGARATITLPRHHS